MQTMLTLAERTPNTTLLPPGRAHDRGDSWRTPGRADHTGSAAADGVHRRSGEAGVVWDRFFGTRVDTVYGEGVHVIASVEQVLQMRRAPAIGDQRQITCPCTTGLPIKVSASVRYRLSGAPFKYVVNQGSAPNTRSANCTGELVPITATK